MGALVGGSVGTSVFFTVLGIRIDFSPAARKNHPNSHIRQKLLKKLYIFLISIHIPDLSAQEYV